MTLEQTAPERARVFRDPESGEWRFQLPGQEEPHPVGLPSQGLALQAVCHQLRAAIPAPAPLAAPRRWGRWWS